MALFALFFIFPCLMPDDFTRVLSLDGLISTVDCMHPVNSVYTFGIDKLASILHETI
jgi:hypothetical protein